MFVLFRFTNLAKILHYFMWSFNIECTHVTSCSEHKLCWNLRQLADGRDLRRWFHAWRRHCPDKCATADVQMSATALSVSRQQRTYAVNRQRPVPTQHNSRVRRTAKRTRWLGLVTSRDCTLTDSLIVFQTLVQTGLLMINDFFDD